MRTRRLVLLVIVTLTLTVACNRRVTERPHQSPVANTPAASPATDALAATRVIFKENCAKCHGEDGAGGRVQVEGKEIKVPNLTGEHARKPTDERIATKIAEGDDDMPAFKDKLTPAQIQDLVQYIRKEFQGQ